ELAPDRRVSGSLVGPDGKPVTGATAYGLEQAPPAPAQAQTLSEAAFAAKLLSPDQPRTVFFVHRERRLVGQAVLRGDEPAPVVVHLRPWAEITGRLTDGAGRPLAGVRVGWRCPSLPASNQGPAGLEATTDDGGRFHIKGLVPGVATE